MTIKNNKLGYISLALAAIFLVGCGSSSSGTPKNSGTGSIDLADYFPTADTSKTFTTVDGNTTEFQSGSYDETITVKTNDNNRTVTTVDEDGDSVVVTITDKNITTVGGSDTYSSFRHMNIGDTVYSLKDSEISDIKQSGIDFAKVTRTVDLECTIDKKLEKFVKGEHKYTGDILKIKCIDNGKVIIAINPALMAIAPEKFKDINGTHDNYDMFDVYVKKDIGEVATIDDDCILYSDTIKYQDDRKSECVEKRHNYDYYLEK